MHKAIAVLALLVLAACGVDTRGLISQSHFHTAGPNTLRVELIDMTEFIVRESGDRGLGGRQQDGELHDMFLSLAAPSEFSSATGRTTTGLVNLTDPETTFLRIVTIARNDLLTWGRAATYDNETVWVEAEPGARVSLKVMARDLDCTRDRVCGRYDDGAFTFDFVLPALPAQLVPGCPPTQVFVWGEEGGRAGFRGAREVEVTTTGRPIIEPVNGAICIRPAPG